MMLYLRNILLIFLIVLCFASISGCSMLTYERNYKIDTDNNTWVKFNKPTYPKENAQYKDNTISITTKSSYDVSFCPVSIGPPILPIIPLFFFCVGDDSNLHLEFIIDNLSDELIIDIKRIILLKPSDQVVPIYRSSYCPAGEGYNSGSCSYSKEGNKIVSSSKSISTSPLILNKGRYILSFSYLKIGNPDELTLDFGKVSSDGRQITIPPLKLRSNNGIAYVPLMASGH